MNSVALFYRRTGPDVRSITAYIDDQNGDLVIDGQDIGPIVEKIWGDSDYEYWLRIPRSQKAPLYRSLATIIGGDLDQADLDAALLGLLQQRFNDDAALNNIRNWCAENAILAKFSNYV